MIDAAHQVEVGEILIPSRESYSHSLRIYTGRYSNAPLLKVAARPFLLFWYPAIFVLFAIFGVMMTWSVVYSGDIGVIFVNPPYNFPTSQADLTSLSPLIMSIMGEVVSGTLTDAICPSSHVQEQGHPRTRIPSRPCRTRGSFGHRRFLRFRCYRSLSNPSDRPCADPRAFPHGSDVCVDLSLWTRSRFSPNTQCRRPRGAQHAQCACFRNTPCHRRSAGTVGPLDVFTVLGSAFPATCVCTIPLWILGKRRRSWIARNEGLSRFMSDPVLAR